MKTIKRLVTIIRMSLLKQEYLFDWTYCIRIFITADVYKKYCPVSEVLRQLNVYNDFCAGCCTVSVDRPDYVRCHSISTVIKTTKLVVFKINSIILMVFMINSM
jgi:hypothetical protein